VFDMSKYKSLFESTDKDDTIKQALNFADDGPTVARKKAFRFMFFLSDNNDFDREEIIQMCVEFYAIARNVAEGVYKTVEKAGDI